MTKKRNQHVVPTKNGWAVKRAGSPKLKRVPARTVREIR